jgi:hypothetical protein
MSALVFAIEIVVRIWYSIRRFIGAKAILVYSYTGNYALRSFVLYCTMASRASEPLEHKVKAQRSACICTQHNAPLIRISPVDEQGAMATQLPYYASPPLPLPFLPSQRISYPSQLPLSVHYHPPSNPSSEQTDPPTGPWQV